MAAKKAPMKQMIRREERMDKSSKAPSKSEKALEKKIGKRDPKGKR